MPTYLSGRSAPALIGVLLLAALTACADDEGATPEQTPSSYIFEPVETADLASLCDDSVPTFADAVAYTGPGPHTIAIFADLQPRDQYDAVSLVTEGDVADGTPARSERVELLACGTFSTTDEHLDVCTYTDGLRGLTAASQVKSIPLYAREYSFNVYELRTGRVVTTVTQSADNETYCPSSIKAWTDPADPSAEKQWPEKVYGELPQETISGLFHELVKSPVEAAD